MTTPTSVQYCPQANEPGGGANPPETFTAVVEEVERPFCVTLTYQASDDLSRYRVTHVPAAGPMAKDPIPGCYQPSLGTVFPIGYVEALGVAETPLEAQDVELHEPKPRRL